MRMLLYEAEKLNASTLLWTTFMNKAMIKKVFDAFGNLLCMPAHVCPKKTFACFSLFLCLSAAFPKTSHDPPNLQKGLTYVDSQYVNYIKDHFPISVQVPSDEPDTTTYATLNDDGLPVLYEVHDHPSLVQYALEYVSYIIKKLQNFIKKQFHISVRFPSKSNTTTRASDKVVLYAPAACMPPDPCLTEQPKYPTRKAHPASAGHGSQPIALTSPAKLDPFLGSANP
jgi:hypothetical protein